MPGEMHSHLPDGRVAQYHPLDDVTARRIVLLMTVLGLLFLLDILTTQEILLRGGVELNPLMTGIVAVPAHHVLLKSGILLFIVAAAVMAERRVQGASLFFFATIILFYSGVILNNLLVMHAVP